MQFRWVAIIALWTMLIAPILGTPSSSTSSARQAAVKTVPAIPVSASATRR